MNGSEPTVIASWVSIGLNAFRAKGVDAEGALEYARLRKETLKDPLTPIPLSQTAALWDFAEQQLNCPSLGLECARFVNFTTFHSLGYAVLASASLHAAFVRITAYSNAATDVGHTFLLEESDRFIFGFTLNPLATHVPSGCIDMTLAIFRFMCRLMHDEKPAILALELARTERYAVDVFQKVFSSQVIFDSHRYALHFDRAYFLKPLPTANEVVAKANDRCVEELIHKMSKPTLVTHVRQAIFEHLHREVPVTIERIAHHLGMSERNLQRGLQEESSSFRELFDQERQKLARRYLIESNQTICHIAHRLGFSDSANFGRAFKRWFNCNPLEFRESNMMASTPAAVC